MGQMCTVYGIIVYLIRANSVLCVGL